MTAADRGFWRGIAAQVERLPRHEPRTNCGNGCSWGVICGTCIGRLAEHTTDPRAWLLYHWSLGQTSWLSYRACEVAASIALSESEAP